MHEKNAPLQDGEAGGPGKALVLDLTGGAACPLEDRFIFLFSWCEKSKKVSVAFRGYKAIALSVKIDRLRSVQVGDIPTLISRCAGRLGISSKSFGLLQ